VNAQLIDFVLIFL